MHQALPCSASKVHASSCKTSHSLPPRRCLQGGQATQLCCSLWSGYVCVFCSSGRLSVFPDQVHTLEIQQFLRVPTLGLHGGLADGTLLHGLHSSLRHLHPLENQRTPEAGTGIVITGRVTASPRWLMGRAPGKMYVAHFFSEKARWVRVALPQNVLLLLLAVWRAWRVSAQLPG